MRCFGVSSAFISKVKLLSEQRTWFTSQFKVWVVCWRLKKMLYTDPILLGLQEFLQKKEGGEKAPFLVMLVLFSCSSQPLINQGKWPGLHRTEYLKHLSCDLLSVNSWKSLLGRFLESNFRSIHGLFNRIRNDWGNEWHKSWFMLDNKSVIITFCCSLVDFEEKVELFFKKGKDVSEVVLSAVLKY